MSIQKYYKEKNYTTNDLKELGVFKHTKSIKPMHIISTCRGFGGVTYYYDKEMFNWLKTASNVDITNFIIEQKKLIIELEEKQQADKEQELKEMNVFWQKLYIELNCQEKNNVKEVKKKIHTAKRTWKNKSLLFFWFKEYMFQRKQINILKVV